MGGTAPWPPAMDSMSQMGGQAHHSDYFEEARIANQEAGGGESGEMGEDFDGDYGENLAAPTRGQAMSPSGPNDWSASERPIIRPPVAGNPNMRGRASGPMSRVASTDQFGEEESELDRPTFIRRGILPPG